MQEKHVIVVSIDAMVYEDLAYARTLPVFSQLLQRAALIERVQSVYPTVTHTAHATIMSGCPPMQTGIIANEHCQMGVLHRTWFNHLSEMRCDTLFHAAHRAGLTTAACRWPVTAGGGEVIDYLVPEVMRADMQGREGEALQVYRELGSSECLLDVIQQALQIYGCTNDHPAYDEFEMFCAAEIVRRYRPNLLLVHPGYVDGEWHRTGLFTDAVRHALQETDRWLGMLLAAVREAGIEESTDFVLLSDHGQISIYRSVCPNVLLGDAGLLQVDAQGALRSWEAYVCSCGASAQVYLARPHDVALYARVQALLTHWAEEKLYGIEQVLTTAQVRERYGLDGAFSFVLETDGLSSFHDAWTRPVVRDLDVSDYRYGRATHGYLPEKGPQPIFAGAGPSFQAGVVLPHGHLCNHAPTIARVLGIALPQSQGHAEEAMLRGQ